MSGLPFERVCLGSKGISCPAQEGKAYSSNSTNFEQYETAQKNSRTRVSLCQNDLAGGSELWHQGCGVERPTHPSEEFTTHGTRREHALRQCKRCHRSHSR